MVRPETTIGPPVAEPIMLPGFEVAVYVKMVDPPLKAGGVYVTVALPLPADA